MLISEFSNENVCHLLKNKLSLFQFLELVFSIFWTLSSESNVTIRGHSNSFITVLYTNG